MNRSTHYDALGIPQNATQAAIHRAYIQLSLTLHPFTINRSLPASEIHAQLDKYEDASHAYKVLRDPEKRKKYDEKL
ncbi:hypothetical protein K458DRAFT_292470, partial [Lentithecium fluviatile CBS 122367]